MAQARLLEGGLQQSQSLPPLSEQFQVGAPFSEEMLGRPENLDEWIMIPASLAGTWARDGSVLLSLHDEQTNKWTYPNEQSFPQGSYVRGFQADSQGNIWDCPRARRQRFETSADGKTRIYIVITGRRQMLVTGPNSIRDYGEVTLVDVDIASGRIVTVSRSEQIVERKVLQYGVISAESSKRTFTPQGKLIATYTDRSQEKRTALFLPVDTINGFDLRASFQKFITSQPGI